MRKLFILSFLVFNIFTFNTKIFAEQQNSLSIKSESVILMDTKSGAVLYQKNGNERMYPASLTKIATAIYAIEKGDLNEIVSVSQNAYRTPGSSVYLEIGEQMPLKQLIQGMLINSGNDAAVAIADHLDGSVAKFSANLNQFLKEKVKVLDTHFSNPHGLFAEDHYTTAEDIGKITNYAMKNAIFREMFGAKIMEWDGQSWDTTLITHHLMLKGEFPYSGITGGKTGYVSQAKSTLATTAENENIQLTAIVLKAPNQRAIYQDTKELFDYGFENFKTTSIPASQKFTVNETSFHPVQSLFITEPLSGVQYDVTKDGVLKVMDNEQTIIQTVQLTPEINSLRKEVTDESMTGNSLINMNTLFGTIVVLLAGAVFQLIKKQSKQTHN